MKIKKLLCIFALCFLFFSLSACSWMSVSNRMYNRISEYVTENMELFTPTGENEFYAFKTSGLSVGGIYYGYYYSPGNELLLPDIYAGNDFEKIQNDLHDDNGGTYFGSPNNGTDWCFIKKISDNWFYYELHWA